MAKIKNDIEVYKAIKNYKGDCEIKNCGFTGNNRIIFEIKNGQFLMEFCTYHFNELKKAIHDSDES